MAKEYAHDPHCNTAHEAGPEPCPPTRETVETLIEHGMSPEVALSLVAGGLSPEKPKVIGLPLPEPGCALIVVNDGDVYGSFPVTREFLADVAPAIETVIAEGLEQVRRG